MFSLLYLFILYKLIVDTCHEFVTMRYLNTECFINIFFYWKTIYRPIVLRNLSHYRSTTLRHIIESFISNMILNFLSMDFKNYLIQI
jgi:hypothetical protein